MSEILEKVRCNICGGEDTGVFLRMEGWTYRRCRSCGLVYQNPRPVFHDLKKRYRGNYFAYELSNQQNFFNLMKLGLRDIGFEHLFDGDCRGRWFLDIGCATGLLLNHLKQKGWRTTGVELCRESAEYGIQRFGLDIFIGTLEQAAFPDRFFDVVHFSHLIEHVPDPRGLLAEVRRVVKPDGHVVLTTPNAGGLHARFSGPGWRSAIPDHVYLFARRTLRRLLRETGFRVVRQVSWGGIPAGRRPDWLKRPADRLAKALNVGDVMLFHCVPEIPR
jgi:2-polyprenyl-3-methyl-5-hydroxy-6-metoxy-1,4-benzoquinol methylase